MHDNETTRTAAFLASVTFMLIFAAGLVWGLPPDIPQLQMNASEREVICQQRPLSSRSQLLRSICRQRSQLLGEEYNYMVEVLLVILQERARCHETHTSMSMSLTVQHAAAVCNL